MVSEIYVVDEAGLMRPDSLALHSDGTVHFRQSKKGEEMDNGTGGGKDKHGNGCVLLLEEGSNDTIAGIATITSCFLVVVGGWETCC